MSKDSPNPYDAMLYHGVALPQTHPDRLATHARLRGLEPAPLEQCRVLDVGCGNGSNLLPMAFGLPESEFVGIDLAARPIAIGQKIAREAGLTNLALHQLDIMDFSDEWGTFDYIIAHGFYSWVPPDVRDRFLAVCKAHLAPHGIAYISYNVYPGWRLFESAREMMLYHVRQIEDPQKRIRQGRSLLHFLRDSQPETSEDPPFFSAFLHNEVQRISKHPDWLLQHDLMARINDPCYFHEFAEHVGRHGLQYLGEAEFGVMHARDFPPQVGQMLNKFDSLIHREQYLDFLRGRSFRQTLLCHQNVALDSAPSAEQWKAFYVAAPIEELETTADGEGTTFIGINKHKIETRHPFTREMCRYLGACWPRYVSFDELLEATQTNAESDAPEKKLAADLANILYEFYVDHFIELHAYAPRVANTVSERPQASPLACVQLRTSPIVSTLLHKTVQLNEVEMQLLPLLNGRRNIKGVLRALTKTAAASPPKGKKKARSRPDSLSAKALEHILDGLMQHGLLLA